jgi:glycosyltransferase involved in cell wall biosynthesis
VPFEQFENKLKIRSVVPRYSADLLGGAEKHARDLMHLLPCDWDLEVYTTCAKDYISWKNEFRSGKEMDGNISVFRFPVEHPRRILKFNKLTDNLKESFPQQSSIQEETWLKEQGPYSPKLIENLLKAPEADLTIFFSYLYYPIIEGLRRLKGKKIFFPMMHDEFPAYLNIYRECFGPEIHYAFLSPEEIDVFERIYGFRPSSRALVGTHVEGKKNLIKSKNTPDYLLGVGRMDIGKGFGDLIRLFQSWKDSNSSSVELWIAGNNPPSIMRKYESDSIRFLGRVSEAEKFQFMKDALLFINPSALESFSIVIMEAWSQGTPVLVNGKSEVLRGHCVRSNGGLWYTDEESFSGCLNLVLQNKELRSRLGENGKKYMEINFSKDMIRERLSKFFEELLVKDSIGGN